MSRFQIFVLSLLGLIASAIFATTGVVYLALAIPEQVSIPVVDTTPAPTPDTSFVITPNSLGSKNALVKEITNKGWKLQKVETMPDGTRCDTYEDIHIKFGLCAVGDELKVIIIKGDAFANFNPVFVTAGMYDIHYFGDFRDAVTDIWFDLLPGESTPLILDTDGVIMTIKRTYDDGYGIAYILESHLP